MPTRLTTDDIALRERPAYWNFLVSNVLGRLQTTPQQDKTFTGAIDYSHLSTIPIAKVQSTQLRVQRPEKFIDGPDEDFYKVNLQLQGQATLTQEGRQAVLTPGNWVIYDNTRPYDLQFHSDYQQLLFLVPRKQLMHRLPTIDLWLAKSLTSEKGMGKLLFNFVRDALQESEEITPEVQVHSAQMLLDMLLLGLADTAEVAPPVLPASSRKLQVDQFIRTHLHDPDLSVGMIAERLHLSKRTIQKLFAAEDTTVNQFIWQNRIDQIKTDLRNPSLASMPLQDIASAWGFRSNAHFSRLFKQSTGMTPTDYRKRLATD